MTEREKIRAELRTIESSLRTLGASLHVTEDEEDAIDEAAKSVGLCADKMNETNEHVGLE